MTSIAGRDEWEERFKAAAEESESSFRMLFEQSPISIQLLAPDGRTLAVNRAWMQLWSVDREFVEQYILKEYNLFSDPQLAAKGILPLIRRGFEGETVSFPPMLYDPAEIGKPGTARWTESVMFPLRDASGKVRELVLMHEDITERVQAERALNLLADSGALLSTALDHQATLEKTAELATAHLGGWSVIHIPDGGGLRAAVVAHQDPGARARGWELEATARVSLDSPAGPGKVFRDQQPELLSLGREPAKVSEGLLGLSGLKSYLCVAICDPSGKHGTLTLASSERLYNSQDLALAGELAQRAAIAINQARLYDEARSAIQLREDFMSIAAHELRTPITPLKMQLELLRKLFSMNPEDRRQHEESVLALTNSSDQQLARLMRLIDDLLDASRLSTGRLTLNREKVQLERLVGEVIERLRPELRKAECEVELEVVAGVSGSWDYLRVEQVVVNLISNAMKYGAGKPIHISVSRDTERAVLRVRDCGIGIPEEDQARIFRRFERAVSVKKFGGLGLGLYIASQIVEAHGGSIRVSSAPGRGATFTVELPISR